MQLRDDHGRTPLLIAVKAGSLECVEYIMEKLEKSTSPITMDCDVLPPRRTDDLISADYGESSSESDSHLPSTSGIIDRHMFRPQRTDGSSSTNHSESRSDSRFSWTSAISDRDVFGKTAVYLAAESQHLNVLEVCACYNLIYISVVVVKTQLCQVAN